MKTQEGPIAAVTGGASGIGDAIVRRLLLSGARVAVLDINASLLAEREREFGRSFYGFPGDVTDEEVVAHFVAGCAKRFGRLDKAFNVAGSSKTGPITTQTTQEWDFTLDLCLKGVFLSLKHEARQMLSQSSGGAIVNVSSVCAHFPVYGAAAYCAAKSGVEMLTKVAALELAQKGIRVNAVLPGYTDTPGIRAGKELLPGYDKEVTDRVPLRRAASPAEIANAAVFLAGEDATYVVGTSLVVDGGWELTACPDFRRFSEPLHQGRL